MSPHLLFWDLDCSSFSKALRYTIKLMIWGLANYSIFNILKLKLYYQKLQLKKPHTLKLTRPEDYRTPQTPLQLSSHLKRRRRCSTLTLCFRYCRIREPLLRPQAFERPECNLRPGLHSSGFRGEFRAWALAPVCPASPKRQALQCSSNLWDYYRVRFWFLWFQWSLQDLEFILL